MITCAPLFPSFRTQLPTYAALRSPAAVPSPLPPRSAYVVPALEQRDPAAVAPLFGMAPLRAAVRANATGEFHALSYPAGHARTRTAEWLEAGGPYELAAGQSQAAREDTLRKHDPFVLFSRSDPALPPFNPLFVNRGGNKAAWARGLREAGYRFTVLPGAWAVHVWEADPARLPFMPKPRQAAARAVGPALAWRDGWRAGAAAAAAPGARAARF